MLNAPQISIFKNQINLKLHFGKLNAPQLLNIQTVLKIGVLKIVIYLTFVFCGH